MANDRFRGHSTHTLDEKGRVSIPAKIRSVLTVLNASSLVLVPWNDHLRAYPEDEWAKYEDRLLGDGVKKGMGRLLRALVNNSITTSVDKQGRLLISSIHREKLNFKKELVVAGNVHWFEFWDPQVYEKENAETLEDFSKYEEELSEIGLL
jgi:MraZ protein